MHAPRRPLAVSAFWTLFALPWPGCTSSAPLVVIPPARPPEALLVCADEPAPPAAAAATAEDVGLYLVDLQQAGDDCRRKLAAVRRLAADSARGGR